MYALQFSKLNSIVWNKNIIWILLWRFCFYGCFKKNYFKSRFNLSIIYKRVRQGTRYFMKLTILKSVRRKFVPIHLKIREFRARFDIIKRARFILKMLWKINGDLFCYLAWTSLICTITGNIMEIWFYSNVIIFHVDLRAIEMPCVTRWKLRWIQKV